MAPLDLASWTMKWLHKEIKPVIASVSGQGHIDPADMLQLLAGLDKLSELVEFVQKHGDAIKRAAQ
jgi:hypothetical protein